ncbi:hypothetical protein ACH5RR_002908 [Cinchona calisaya]|uniref:Uncharacterized protein n=1 Tax=Cinchona calisaya TaxID=153742 RepID=A0ABD3ATZ1_9GENT
MGHVKNDEVSKGYGEGKAKIRRVCKGKRTIEEANIYNLKYLKMVIQETIRLHLAAPLIPRASRETYEGRGVAKGRKDEGDGGYGRRGMEKVVEERGRGKGDGGIRMEEREGGEQVARMGVGSFLLDGVVLGIDDLPSKPKFQFSWEFAMNNSRTKM